ncbi:prestalk protein-like [Dendronephthya gigantea]|uniref:prestalk protein-like n=1 Tax=Dendronephthya gigantea TaxID=151771 RepID=UPI00106D4D9A|nr:prestalk protein-like [Dendronephthya gigantea]
MCNSNSDCRDEVFPDKLCCRGYRNTRRSCYDQPSCVGRFCWTDGDCGGKDECCISNKCAVFGCKECNSSLACALFEYCCEHQYLNDHNICRRSCVGETCHSSWDCGGLGEFCDSNNVCAVTSCVTDGDCSGDECCWSRKCVRTGCSRCLSNSDCAASEFCCKRGRDVSVCRRRCVGEKCLSDSHCGGPWEYCNLNTSKCEKSSATGICNCSTDGDCSGDACCLYSRCVTASCPRCSANSDCSNLEYCCKRGPYDNVCRRSCVGEKCAIDGHCGGPGESCDLSNHTCGKSMISVDVKCFTDGDCSGNECCRSNKCVTVGCPSCSSSTNKRKKELASWVIPAIIFGSVVLAIIIGSILVYRCCRGPFRRGAEVRPMAAQGNASVIALRESEIRTNREHHRSSPPSAHSFLPYRNQDELFPPRQTHRLPPSDS